MEKFDVHFVFHSLLALYLKKSWYYADPYFLNHPTWLSVNSRKNRFIILHVLELSLGRVVLHEFWMSMGFEKEKKSNIFFILFMRVL